MAKRSFPAGTARRGGRLFAALLCVLALAVNLLGSVAYAESMLGNANGGLGFIDASICHSGPETPVDQDSGGRPKCPLCQVAAAGYHVPAKAQAEPAAAGRARVAVILPQSDRPVPPLPLATRPEPRGPPASV